MAWILSPDGKPITTDVAAQLHRLDLQYGHWVRRPPAGRDPVDFYRREIEATGLPLEPAETSQPRHSHQRPETTVLISGDCRYTVWDGLPDGPGYIVHLLPGDLLVLPAGRLHVLEVDGLILTDG